MDEIFYSGALIILQQTNIPKKEIRASLMLKKISYVNLTF